MKLESPPLKKAHVISDKIFIVIDNNLAQQLGINETSWFSEQIVEDGILLKKAQLQF